jgi:KDO2-lipid IV(A) lauroyltransferase
MPAMHGSIQRLRQWLAYLAVRTFICILQAARLDSCTTVARWLATLCHDRLGIRRAVVDENLRLAFPELSPAQRDRLAWQMWEHLFLFIVEIAHAPRKIHETNWRDFVEFSGGHVLADIALGERPSLLVSAHFGNFELGGFFLGVLGFPTHTVARTLDNPDLDAFLNRFRGVTGQRMVPKKGGYEEIVRVLAGGGMMTFLADQYAGSRGCWVEFFGRPASVHKAIALFALDNQAQLMVGSTRRYGRPMHFSMELYGSSDLATNPPEAASVKSLTQWYTTRLECPIRQSPEQYWWLHRRWKDTRRKRRVSQAA